MQLSLASAPKDAGAFKGPVFGHFGGCGDGLFFHSQDYDLALRSLATAQELGPLALVIRGCCMLRST